MFRTDRIREELNELGLKNISTIHYNLPTPALYEKAIIRGEGMLSHLGPLVVRTGQHTGRSPNDKFIVREPSSEKNIWWGKENQPMEPEYFDRLFARMKAYIQGKELFVQDCFAGADPEYTLPIRVITETAWHSIFARNNFIQIKYDEEIPHIHIPEFTLINMPNFYADPAVDGTNSEIFIGVNFAKKIAIVGGTSYAGEAKKAIFSILNYLMPQEKVLSMHCAANMGEGGDVAVFFGLSGTGKTALSADPTRKLIGDDEHGWSEKGIFNFEGGCYAMVFKISREDEPEIVESTRKFGTVLENVMINAETRRIDLNDGILTENTRASYPLAHLTNIVRDSMAGHPKNIFMLTTDAFGVIPPISKLNPEQAMYHFLSGYTAKVSGTEKGVVDPKATFSACYGAPFIALHPSVYVRLLGERIKQHNVQCWLINTGWTGGRFGETERISIKDTRTMLNAALTGKLASIATREDPHFGFQVPVSCPDIPDTMLNPEKTWKNREEYIQTAKKLVSMFHENFVVYDKESPDEIRNAAPKL
jgi:phosphoenolpyruvate carboxykinase (ATP)